MHFWLNYSDKKNHIERISLLWKIKIAFFCMASEIIESDNLICFYFLTILEPMIINIQKAQKPLQN